VTVTIIGIDPDTTTTGICYVTASAGADGLPLIHSMSMTLARAEGDRAEDRLPLMADAIEAAVAARHADHVVIERQHVRPRDPNPNSLMPVQAVFGAALAAARRCGVHFSRDRGEIHYKRATVDMPIPSEWKGTIPKKKHQPRILQACATYGLAVQEHSYLNVPPSLREHCVDALGMCLWLLRGRRIS